MSLRVIVNDRRERRRGRRAMDAPADTRHLAAVAFVSAFVAFLVGVAAAGIWG